jgi:hypothetical protein
VGRSYHRGKVAESIWLAEVVSLGGEQVDLLAEAITSRAGETKNDSGRTILLPLGLRVFLERQAPRIRVGKTVWMDEHLIELKEI